MNKMALFAIIGTAMFLLSGGVSFAATPAGPTHIQPNPTLNSNLTWSNFYNGWTPLEYSNGTANETLNTGFSQYYANPITVNPLDIQSNQLYNTSLQYFNTSKWTIPAAQTYGSPLTQHIATSLKLNGHNAVIFQTNATGTGSTTWTPYYSIPFADYPSNNIAYDYLTIIANVSTSFTASGQGMDISIANETGDISGSAVSLNTTNNEISTTAQAIYPTTIVELSAPLSSFHGLNWNATKSNGLTIRLNFFIPKIQTSTYLTTTIDSIQMTENPLSIGTSQINGTERPLQDFTNTASLTTFNPDFAWSSITNNGYSVAVSQSLQDLTTQQNAISSGNYIEQVEYQGQFNLPTAPDLSYGSANLTEQFNVSTSQTQVLDINGESYLNTISSKNGTVQLLSSVNPNGQTQFLQIVDYTQSQWNTISNSPGLFTLAGIEYYWWIAVGGLATLIGLGAAAKHAGTKADQERIRRGR